MSRQTITEFLEVRIAEDKEEAEHFLERYKQGEDISKRRWQRILREAEAKQAIVSEHATTEVASLDRETWGKPFEICRTCAAGPRQVVAPCPTLQILAAVYKDHPDYRQEWVL